MPSSSSQTFLKERDKKLWTAAGRGHANLDAAKIEAQVRDPKSDCYLLSAPSTNAGSVLSVAVVNPPTSFTNRFSPATKLMLARRRAAEETRTPRERLPVT